MTVENCLKLLELHKKNGNTQAYENMLEHIRNGRKFQGNPLVAAVLNPTPKKETKGGSDGKKSKG